jgi:hypothetical protein
MKRIFFYLTALSLCGGAGLRAQDAAVEERLNKLSGLVQDLQESRDNQKKQIDALAKEIAALREQQSKPNTTYATQEDLKRLADAFKELDKKREADKQLILKELEKLGKTISSPPPGKKSTPKEPAAPVDKAGPRGAPAANEKSYEYTIQPNDTPTSIARKYNTELGLKLTPDDILKANPGLKERGLAVGKNIWIPAPQDGAEGAKKTQKTE